MTRLEAHAIVWEERRNTNNSFQRRNPFTAPRTDDDQGNRHPRTPACLQPHFVNNTPFTKVFLTKIPLNLRCVYIRVPVYSTPGSAPQSTPCRIATCSLLLALDLGHRRSGVLGCSCEDSAQQQSSDELAQTRLTVRDRAKR